MNFMKFFRKPQLALFFASLIFVVSCSTEGTFSSEEDSIVFSSRQETKDISEKEVRAIFAKYTESFVSVKPNFDRVVEKISQGVKSEDLQEDPDMQTVIKVMERPSVEMFRSLPFKDEQYIEIFGTTKIEEVSDQVAGAGLILYMFQPEYQTLGETPLAVSCFLEATGIAAGVAIIGGLTAGMGGEALTLAFGKLVTKVGVKTLSGIGLALMAAEFTWCMLRD